ncbi:MAG TPA: hypothetical protein VKT51_08845 [Candidatus Eremiobacteraceae bacterium]|nr:hypothetical protein [Candidatus Eremiobacteraceae bacterium]
MIRVSSTAVRAWVHPDPRPEDRYQHGTITTVPFRSRPFGQRALVWDTETSTDRKQKLLYGFFALYEDGQKVLDGVFCPDDLRPQDRQIVEEFAKKNEIEIMTLTEFVEKVLYPECYQLGSLCVGFNLPFDISRIALGVTTGTGRNRKRFMFTLSNRIRWPRIGIEPISGKAAFIRFAFKKFPAKWERPMFAGRFLDLSTLVTALTGERHTLRSAGRRFCASIIKSKTEDLGKVTPDALRYAHIDVEATWALYERLRDEYLMHPFASLENELHQSESTLPITRLYSTASVSKKYLSLMGYQPLLETQPKFDLKYFGYASSAYFGGRAEARVRRVDVPVTVVDFTSMYPTVFQLQNLQALIEAKKLRPRQCTRKARELLNRITINRLFDPKTWPLLRMLVRVKADGDILPVRFRLNSDQPYAISVTHLTSHKLRWHCLADVVQARLLGNTTPEIVEAVEFVPKGRQSLHPVRLRGQATLDPDDQIFKTVVEERQKAKRANQDGSDENLGRLDKALKEFAAGASYGINFEVNVTPSPAESTPTGDVYSDDQFHSKNIKDERPGRFCNPIVASFVTAGSRLMLAMAECRVNAAGGCFAFCDTDSLAIVSGDDCPVDIPCISQNQVGEIIQEFNCLNPYDPRLVPNLLKIEHENVRCWVISAKRYVLFKKSRHFKIIKASESGLGGIIGRTNKENTEKLSRRLWLRILIRECGERYGYTFSKWRSKLIKFDGPVRRKLPLSQTEVYRKFKQFNKSRAYADQIKPFGFIQTVVPAIEDGDRVQPIAPFEQSAAKSRRLKWIDCKTGELVTLDWSGTGLANSVPVSSMTEFIDRYATHPEAKAAGPDGCPCQANTRGLLGRLHLEDFEPIRIGKEIDRLDEDKGASLECADPVSYEDESDPELNAAVCVLAKHRQGRVAKALGMSERRWRDILQGYARPHEKIRGQILRLAPLVAVDPSTI